MANLHVPRSPAGWRSAAMPFAKYSQRSQAQFAQHMPRHGTAAQKRAAAAAAAIVQLCAKGFAKGFAEDIYTQDYNIYM